tara:strand:- start:22966 stop:23154 length:189 start_codon:yes stop_codon:yes gene_type:complete
MAKKNKYLVFNIFTKQFEDDIPEDQDYNEYIQIIDAEKEIARKMIKLKLEKIEAKDYDESTD